MQRLIEHLKEEWLKAFFIASVVFFIHHTTALFTPFDDASLHLVTATSSEHASFQANSKVSYRGNFRWYQLKNNKIKNSPIILTYDQNTFDSLYKGITPLNRCIFNSQLQQVLNEKPKLVFIDIDLSPLKYPNNDYLKCQKILDATLDKHKNQLILIKPMQDIRQIGNPTINRWEESRRAKGVTIANQKIEGSLGIVLNGSPYSDSVAHLIEKKLYNISGNEESEESHATPLNYTFLGKFYEPMPSKSDSITNKVVFIGGTYGTDDFYLTPIGENIPGVMIHAYDFLTLLYPINTHGIASLIGYLLDFVFAIIVGFIMTGLWAYYLKTVREDGHVNSELSFLVLLFILSFLVCLIVLSMYIAGFVLHYNIWISPIPIIIAIFFDGIVSSLIGNSTHKQQTVVQKKANKFYKKLKTYIMIIFILYSPVFLIIQSLLKHYGL